MSEKKDIDHKDGKEYKKPRAARCPKLLCVYEKDMFVPL